MAEPLSGGRWITVNGEHRYIGSDGSVEAGRPFFKPDDEVRPTEINRGERKLEEKKYGRKFVQYSMSPNSPTDSEQDAVHFYAKQDYDGINRHLRSLKDSRPLVDDGNSKSIPTIAARIQSAVKNAPETEEDQILYRHFNHDPQHEVGETIEHKGFLSTASLSQSAFMRNTNTASEYEIAVPKGSKGVLSGFNDAELETLLGHNSKFKVLGKKQLQYDVGGSEPQTRTIYQLAYLGPGESNG